VNKVCSSKGSGGIYSLTYIVVPVYVLTFSRLGGRHGIIVKLNEYQDD